MKKIIRTKLVILLACLSVSCVEGQKLQLILDADTGNEIDDLFAIARMVEQDTFEVVGLNSTQWFHRRSGDRTVFESQTLNEELLRLLGREEIPALLGSNDVFGDWWGGADVPKDSEAAQFIIEKAKAMPDGEKLYVVCTGALTNLASAISLAPEIAPRISAHVLIMKYDLEKGIWNKSSFNARRDLSAVDYVLNKTDLELHIMPNTVARGVIFEKGKTFTNHVSMGELGAFLTAAWETDRGSRQRPFWTIWDLALVEALISPELATKRETMTPLENTPRKIWIYDSINAAAMQENYWKAVLGLEN